MLAAPYISRSAEQEQRNEAEETAAMEGLRHADVEEPIRRCDHAPSDRLPRWFGGWVQAAVQSGPAVLIRRPSPVQGGVQPRLSAG